MASTQTSSSSVVNNEDRFLYLKEVAIDFTRSRPNGRLQIKLKDEKGTRYESKVFGETEPLQWDCEFYDDDPKLWSYPEKGLDRQIAIRLQLV
ncbi:uncharacterized protein FOMMEDRAFT_157584 [Fomitiporia mediterranea MF3/22]|uniref:uncharacterized protein n=1 Tax=Fomitiporia mediterranea (strain MF3/22) TaxID=694068 RepID=UPI00044091A7|nr:uncharacterized protein FOMMEDRAFT_157584 [Fomitiporia mediterranea MF3/22]EJD02371.1 hypothetical protein FOMMEDRAFT_157584 [Fomitiporia mediterranea MF3/22]